MNWRELMLLFILLVAAADSATNITKKAISNSSKAAYLKRRRYIKKCCSGGITDCAPGANNTFAKNATEFTWTAPTTTTTLPITANWFAMKELETLPEINFVFDESFTEMMPPMTNNLQEFSPCLSMENCKILDVKILNDIKITHNQPSDNGVSAKVCGKVYFLANEKATWLDAQIDCCKRGMELLHIQDVAEQQCIKAHFDSKNDSLREPIWLSAISKVKESDFQWCIKGEAHHFEQSEYLKFFSSIIISGSTCLQALTSPGMPMKISPVLCKTEIRYVCKSDVDPTFPNSCPDTRTVVDSKQAKETQDIISAMVAENRSRYLSYQNPPMFVACNSSFIIFDTEMFSWLEAYDQCKVRGMRMLSIESEFKLKCLTEVLADQPGAYWTSGTNLGAKSADIYGWCSTRKVLDSAAKLWAEGFPENPQYFSLIIANFGRKESRLNGLQDTTFESYFHVICETQH